MGFTGVLEISTKAIDRIWGQAVAKKLRDLPAVTEPDGSRWVATEDIEAIAAKLEKGAAES